MTILVLFGLPTVLNAQDDDCRQACQDQLDAELSFTESVYYFCLSDCESSYGGGSSSWGIGLDHGYMYDFCEQSCTEYYYNDISRAFDQYYNCESYCD